MMGFKSVQEKIERARIKAASAAKKLSLNEMAKQDDYIHSEGLNVGGGASHNSNSNSNRNSNNNSRGRKEKSILDELDAVNASFGESGHTTTAERTFGMTMNRDGSGIGSDDDDDSVDSYDPNKDPLLQMAYNKSSENAHQHQHQHSSSWDNDDSKKDPNRFLADLDARISSPNEAPTPPSILTMDTTTTSRNGNKPDDSYDGISIITPSNRQQQQQQQSGDGNGNNLFESFSNSGNKLNWLRNVASPKIQESFNNVIKQVPGSGNLSLGIGLTKYDQVSGNEEHNDMETGKAAAKSKTTIIKTQNGENIHVISSTSLALGDAESAELERLNQLMNKSNNNVLMTMLGLVEKNRYYLFIVLTFILTTFGYLYTRKRTDESVT